MSPLRARHRRLVTRTLLGVTSLLVGALLGVATLWWSPVTSIPGTAIAAPGPAPRDVASTSEDGDGSAPDPGPRDEPEAREEPSPQPVRGQEPGTIRLPNGGTANLVREEVGSDAVLPVPDDLNDATWWGAGLDAPSGASLFAGHVNWQGMVGPFAELWDSQVGQSVNVQDERGKDWTYRINQIVTVDKDDLPNRAQELFGQDGPHRLVLVTCGGRWIGGDTGYASNRIVIAEPAS
ncbi:class F sortase [Tamaricihabitans halophyticus]|nr:class F sortase [Tamaricihabitans halophyticus]